MTPPMNNRALRTGLPGRHFVSHHSVPAELHQQVHQELQHSVKKPLQVMKFGGTSVGDASCIARVVEIIRAAARESQVVVVVSAMSGVTNQLVEAATLSEAGKHASVGSIFEGIRRQHERAIEALIPSAEERTRITSKMKMLLEEADRFCQGASLLGELTPRSRDAISGLGERLSAPLVAAALAERGVASAAIDATELVVTDSCHGGAEPQAEPTRERSEARLRPLLDQGIVPVVTGFIGATPDGALTTLGRGGSDYSATILGAAIKADEVIIWTDVDGLQTSDPRMVAGGRTVPELSYREASELAYFGAKVLHPKTLRAVMPCGIPLWIRNTFAPERPGTRITPAGQPSAGAVKAVTAIPDVVLIKLGGAGMAGAPDVLGRVFRTTAGARADVLLISQSSSQNDLCLVIPSAPAKRTLEALRREFAPELASAKTESITVDSTVAIVAVILQQVIVQQVMGQQLIGQQAIGQRLRGIAGVVGRTCSALDHENVSIVAIAQGSNECTLSLVVAKGDMKAALMSIHREFELGDASDHSSAEPAMPYPCYQTLPTNNQY
jgi:bifunctional aspartokinase / homoserine dehydrogenase 1